MAAVVVMMFLMNLSQDGNSVMFFSVVNRSVVAVPSMKKVEGVHDCIDYMTPFLPI